MADSSRIRGLKSKTKRKDLENKRKANENKVISRREEMKSVKAVILAAGEGTKKGSGSRH